MAPYVMSSLFVRSSMRKCLGRASIHLSHATKPLVVVPHRVRNAHTKARPTLPMFSLEGKVCVVTGASQGLGASILTAFALSGAHGAVIDLSIDSAKSSVESMKQTISAAGLPSQDIQAYECNTADESAVTETFDKIASHFGHIDVTVLNAGITGGTAIEDTEFKDWKQMMDVNVNGTFLCARAAGRHMLKHGKGGSIIMISSMSGHIVNKPQKQAGYNAGKAAVSHMAKSLASEWAPHGIRVNCISPGYIATAANQGEEMEKLQEEWIKMVPMGRVAKPEEFQGTAIWLASDASSYVTGSDIIVDGGYTVW